jgi:isoamylase
MIPAMRAGRPYPLGPTVDALGANFALFSAHAQKVELCLFDPQGRHETARIALPENSEGVWHGFLPDARPGWLYGYRVHGPFAPNEGHRFNPHKLLIDPYAREFSDSFQLSDLHFGHRAANPRADLVMDRRDNSRVMPKSRLIDEEFAWGDDKPLRRPWRDTVIYELHAGGFSRLFKGLDGTTRGTFAALRAPAVIDHLQRLGITAIELLPVHTTVDDSHLADRGLHNYWGYSSIGYFAPDRRFLGRGNHTAFKHMVAALHAAGIEVILDVVYNHTAEGNQLGPTLCFRGIDNASYYWLNAKTPRYYDDFTGCGNSLCLYRPRVLQMVIDSLRYWVEVMHVDGFRFDLATTLARGPHGFDPNAPFLDVIAQDPVLAQVKLIAEPWDLGEGGYQVGQFTPGWSEWNDRFRNTMRRFWRADGGIIGEVAGRFAGSADIYHHSGRKPRASINFVTAHDGFTLQDLVSYDAKHNEANQENNADGTNDNLSWNCGVEGPTDDPAVVALRSQQRRNFLASVLLAQGVPMLLAGDEVANSQNGNNNAYCQDNEIGWIDWSGLGVEGQDLTEFVRRLIAVRRDCGLSLEHFPDGGLRPDTGRKDIMWLRVDGEEMTEPDWLFPDARFLALVLDGRTRPALMLLNGHFEPLQIVLPKNNGVETWRMVINTAGPTGLADEILRVGQSFEVPQRSLILALGEKA